MSKETGIMRDLNLKPGDVVEWVVNGEIDTVVKVDLNYHSALFGYCVKCELVNHGMGIFRDEQFHLISRASDDTPKLWQDMTDEEKGALLLDIFEAGLLIDPKSFLR